MRNFDKNDFEKVRYLEPKFESAIKSRFVTGVVQADLNKVSEVYRECLNRQANLSCGGCVLQMMTQVGRLYFKYKENYTSNGRKRKRNQDPQG